MRTPAVHRLVVAGGALVLCAALTLAGMVTHGMLRRSLDAQLALVLAARSDVVRAVAAVTVDPVELAAALAVQGIRAEVRAPDGSTYPSAPQQPRIAGNLPVDAHARAVERTNVPLPAGGEVVVSVSRDGVDAALRRLAAVLVMAGAAAALLSVVLLLWAARASLRPLSHVAAVADTIAAGAYDRRLRPDRPDTVLGRTATGIDHMLDVLEEALTEARQAELDQRRFLDDAAHQLRTPLTRVVSVAEVLPLAPGAQREALAATVADEARRAAGLVTRLLDLARLDQAQGVPHVVLDLACLLLHEVERAQDLAPDLTIGASVVGPTPLHGDAAQLHDAVANLLDNARRHARSTVGVSLSESDGMLRVEVCDDGPGMDDVQAARAFQRFASLDAHGGSGLGLPIAVAAARAHGGTLVYQRPSFLLTLPGPAAGSNRRASTPLGEALVQRM